ncbi:lipoprotein [Faucicola mancuniensis]|uniref:LPS translocon maturation chaperone LptM n=1 Tax=Faucicola mancuniensis TaxID=1309795 RepID=UPI0028F00222|nr:lipoprotein [uncultured Moraxella sp.]
MKNMKKNVQTLAVSLGFGVLVMGLSACGQKGDLYLPTETVTKQLATQNENQDTTQQHSNEQNLTNQDLTQTQDSTNDY